MATPITADALLKALRSEKVSVEEVRDWRNHNRNKQGPWGPVHGVVIHHTATEGAQATVDLVYDGRPDLPGPLAHACVTKNGTVHLVGHGRTNHAGLGDDDVLRAVIAERRPPSPDQQNADGNRAFYGLECVNLGDGEDTWPEEQLDATARTCAALCRHHGWNARSVIGHLEWTDQKVDPRGFTMDALRDRVSRLLK
ncbi:N-acetylmuramoyl-L-alanine amidase [Streptomyces xiaopingdaonensis]|uniref:N-acetylmuramoyl-L-alanine amidase n=1 Tax=Streptomyces xiaopingdaonensis TaxID=1565415 RepID=UPI0002FE22F5|nr:peptidoglycan recognition family protein [Streptomyces xiaopingdaonensis]